MVQHRAHATTTRGNDPKRIPATRTNHHRIESHCPRIGVQYRSIPCLIQKLCARLTPPAEEHKQRRDPMAPTLRQTRHVAACRSSRVRVGILEGRRVGRDTVQRAGSIRVDDAAPVPSPVLTSSLGRVARLAQCLQVRLVMGATLLERNNVVNLLGWSDAPRVLQCLHRGRDGRRRCESCAIGGCSAY